MHVLRLEEEHAPHWEPERCESFMPEVVGQHMPAEGKGEPENVTVTPQIVRFLGIHLKEVFEVLLSCQFQLS